MIGSRDSARDCPPLAILQQGLRIEGRISMTIGVLESEESLKGEAWNRCGRGGENGKLCQSKPGVVWSAAHLGKQWGLDHSGLSLRLGAAKLKSQVEACRNRTPS
eukprot:scaffold737_cov254-Pinguiococcus_pyrenoidosus.AAC.4